MDLFIITSVINTSNTPLSYVPYRSLLSHKERSDQTVEQIKSIRKYSSMIYIVLIEGSLTPLTQEQIHELSPDHLHIVNHEDIHSPYKAMGESRLLIDYLTSEHFKSLSPNLRRIFKFGGRYSLNNNFSLDNFSLDKVSALSNGGNFNTVLYSIPINLIQWFLDRLRYSHSRPNESIEYTLFDPLTKEESQNYHYIKILGIQGIIAVDTTLTLRYY